MKSWKIVVLILITPFLLNKLRADTIRLGGDFLISSIEKLEDRKFLVRFISEDPQFKKPLVLISDHVHVGVQEGEHIRISAEVLKETDESIEVSQVLLFLPNQLGFTPVWMLSQNATSHELKGARFLQMHAPSADFAIF